MESQKLTCPLSHRYDALNVRARLLSLRLLQLPVRGDWDGLCA